jgi:hypothetical protein
LLEQIGNQKQNKMADGAKLFKAGKSHTAITENQKGIDTHKRAAKFHEEAAMQHHRAAEQLKQDFYDKACGCSVKVQTNILFEN